MRGKKTKRRNRRRGETLRKLRLRLGLNQSQWGAMIGVSRQTISEWERGSEIQAFSRRVLLMLARRPDLVSLVFPELEKEDVLTAEPESAILGG